MLSKLFDALNKAADVPNSYNDMSGYQSGIRLSSLIICCTRYLHQLQTTFSLDGMLHFYKFSSPYSM